MITRFRKRARLFVTTSLVAWLASTSFSLADRRVALVIGNASYQNAPQLANPTNDAGDVAAKLRSLGFEVIERENADFQSYNNALQDFSRRIKDADAALFYYAGHGIQYQGRNYLMPTDSELKDDVSLDNMIAIDRIKDALNRAQNAVKILILDACRNNPLAEDWVRSQVADSRAVSETRGLAPMHIAGTVVAFSTQPNQVAQDGAGRNSPFSSAFIEELSEPGLDVNSLFQRVTEKVNETTHGKQTPEISFSLIRRYYLNTEDTDTLVWSRIRDSENPDDFKAFVKHYPTSFLVPDANYRVTLLEKAISERQAELIAERRREDDRLYAEKQKRLADEREAALNKAEDERKQAEEAARQAALLAKQEQDKAEAALKQAELERRQAEAAARQAALLAKQEQDRKDAALKQAELERRQADEAARQAALLTKQEQEKKDAALKQAELERQQAEAAARQAALLAKQEQDRKDAALKQAELEKHQAAEAAQQAALAAKQEQDRKEAVLKKAELERQQAKAETLQLEASVKSEQEEREQAAKKQEMERLANEAQKPQAALVTASREEIKSPVPVNVASIGSEAIPSADTHTSGRSIADMQVASVSSAEDKNLDSTAAITAPDSHSLVSEAQTELQRLGCFNGKVSGAHDAPTDAALNRYFEKSGQNKGGMAISDSLVIELKAHAIGFCGAKPELAKPKEARHSPHDKAPNNLQESRKNPVERLQRRIEEKHIARLPSAPTRLAAPAQHSHIEVSPRSSGGGVSSPSISGVSGM